MCILHATLYIYTVGTRYMSRKNARGAAVASAAQAAATQTYAAARHATIHAAFSTCGRPPNQTMHHFKRRNITHIYAKKVLINRTWGALGHLSLLVRRIPACDQLELYKHVLHGWLLCALASICLLTAIVRWVLRVSINGRYCEALPYRRNRGHSARRDLY